jgi:hypothetical protein
VEQTIKSDSATSHCRHGENDPTEDSMFPKWLIHKTSSMKDWKSVQVSCAFGTFKVRSRDRLIDKTSLSKKLQNEKKIQSF